MVKVDSLTLESLENGKRKVMVQLVADTKEEVEACGSSGANVVGLTANDTMTLGSMALCADGSLGILNSQGQWNW